MSQKSAVKSSSRVPRVGGLWVFLLVLGGVLAVLFSRSFDPAWVQFANDGPLGAMMSERARMPASFTGAWGDLNGYGIREPGAVPNVTFCLNWLLGPLGFSKFYPPLTLLILGTCAWFFFRQLGLGTLAAVLGGVAAALSPDFFNVACWGVGPQAICFGMNYLALGVVVSPLPLRPWVRYPLAGLAVGMGVMEGADIGAIFSVTTALCVLVRAMVFSESAGKGVAQGVLQVWVVAIFAAFIAAASLFNLIGTQIEGVSGMSKEERTKEEQWEWATQLGSMPKLETLGVLVPGLFGYGMDTPDGGAYWGRSGRHPAWDSYFASGKRGAPPNAGIRFGGAGPYAGIMVLLVSFWAFAHSLRRERSVFSLPQRKFIWFLCAAIVVCLLLSFGRHAPFYRIFFALPFASIIRIPAKFYHVVQWLLLIVFAYGLYGLKRRYMDATVTVNRGLSEQWRFFWNKCDLFERRWIIGCAVALGAAAVGWLAYSSSRSGLETHLQDVQFDAAVAKAIAGFSIRHVGWFVVLFAVAAGLFAVVLSGYFAGRRVVVGTALLGMFLVVDLARVGSHWVKPYNWKERYLEAADNGVIGFLRQKPYEHRVTVWPFSLPGQFAIIQQIYGGLWLQHLFQFYSIQSLDIIQMPRSPRDIAAFDGALAYENTPATLHRVARRWQLTNSRYLFGPVGLFNALNTEIDPQKRFKPVKTFDFTPKPSVINPTRFEQLSVVENPEGKFALFEFTGALPRAKLFSQWQASTNDDAALTQLASKEFNPEQTVLVSEPLPAPKEGATNSAADVVEFKSYAPKRVVLQAKAASPSVLLLNDKYDPNWLAVVDGKPAPLLRCNFIMRGVFLDPGEHTVEFLFRPPVDALYISLGAIALGLVLVGFAFGNGRRSTSRPDPESKPA
jgi:hypothetical protein